MSTRRSSRALPCLVLITDRKRARHPLPDAVARALSVLPVGAAMVLLREKDLPGRELAELARSLLPITRRHDAPLIVSGRADVAVATEADGVHLGGDAPDVASVREMVRERLLVGVSLHGDETAPPEADYALLSPIFPTMSKPGVTTLGLDGLSAGCRRSERTPLYALGGVDATNAGACLEAGAHGVAVLGAVLAAQEPELAAHELWRALAHRS